MSVSIHTEQAVPPAIRTRTANRPMLMMFLRRLGAGVLTWLVCTVVVFLACNILPGDVATAALGKNATPERVDAIREKLNLDSPVPQRYLEWLGGLVTGDLGNSSAAVVQGTDPAIAHQFGPALVNSLTLAGLTLLLLVPLALGIGALAGMYAGRAADHATSLPALFVGSLPEFVFAALVTLVFFQWLGWLPPVSLLAPGDTALSHPDILALPIITLLGVTVAGAMRQVRTGVIEVSREDYVNLARLNGLPGSRVLRRYVLRNAIAPSVQIVAQAAQYLLGGIIIVEGVFNYPGLGQYLLNAVGSRDIPVIQTVAVALAGAFILINILADMLVVLLVPSLRPSR